MRPPGSAAPLPAGQHKLERAVGGRTGGRSLVDGGQRLRRGLCGYRPGQSRVASSWIGPPVGELGQDQRPGRVVARPEVIQAAQAGSTPRDDQGTDHPDCLASGDREVRDPVADQPSGPVRRLTADEYRQVRPRSGGQARS